MNYELLYPINHKNHVLVQKVAGIFGQTNVNQYFCTKIHIFQDEKKNTGHTLEVEKHGKRTDCALD